MKELTPEQLDIIEKAAKEQAPKGRVYAYAKGWQDGFDAGNFNALCSPDLIGPVLEEFSEWIRTFEALERQNGQWVIESQLSDKQIVKAFLTDKQKESV